MNRRFAVGTAVGTGLFGAAGFLGGAGLLTLMRLELLGATLAGAAIYDLDERRVPNWLVLPASALCTALAFAAGAPSLAIFVGLALVGLLFGTSMLWPQALGMGDVKLTLLLVLGLDGDALRAFAVGLALAALAGITLLARRGGSAWQSSLPLAPFLAAGALVSVLSWSVA